MTTRSSGEIPVRRREGGIPGWLWIIGLIALALIALVLLGVLDLGALGGGAGGSGADGSAAPAQSGWLGAQLA